MANILEDDPSSGFQSSDDEPEEAAVESLVQGRAKRSTAGTHMSALIEAAADDDLTLLFEEVEDDNEFAVEPEGAEDEDDGLDSSSDDDDDQGPNATNDYEGEKELQKTERRKRRAQNDLRFQTLRKRVKIDPTAVSSVPVPARPKKKSERISWLPTVEDGPVRSSSRRQTMDNKEKTHARLKDSQEKRIRIIATMKEAEKRKAHLKPKKMTQEDHLAEAARIERLNSKSLNRWEQAERRKADERRARIEALQNRRLEGPVMSYWSGLATWVNGHLTRVGKAEIKLKPEKDTTKKKKSVKDDKTPAPTQTPAAVEGSVPPDTPGPATAPISGPAPPINPSTVPEGAQPPSTTTQPNPAPASNQHQASNESIPPITATPSGPEGGQPVVSDEKPSEPQPPNVPTSEKEAEYQVVEQVTSEAPCMSSEGYPLPTVDITTQRTSDDTEKASADAPSGDETSAEKLDAMDVDAISSEPKSSKADEAQPNIDTQAPVTGLDKPAEKAAEATQAGSASNATGDLPESVTQPDTPAAPPAVPQTPQPPPSAQTPQATHTSSTIIPTPTAPPEINAPTGQADGPGTDTPNQPPGDGEAPMQPEVPGPPPVIEYTGRNLTILENFDDRTAHSKKYSMYFNARKPPRLTSMYLTINAPEDDTISPETNHCQKSHHHCALSHPSHPGIATQKPRCPTQIPTPTAKSDASCRRGTPGARCWAVSSAPARQPRAESQLALWVKRRRRVKKCPRPKNPRQAISLQRTNRNRAKTPQLRARWPSRWRLIRK